MKWLIGIGVALVLVIVVVVTMMNIKAKQIALKENYEAQQKSLQSAHDNMWKTIQQKFGVAESYKDGFIKSVQAVVEGRKGGNLFKSVQENMPGLSPEVYKDVMATIEGRRDMLKRANDTSADMAREYNTYVLSPWHSWALSDTRRIEAKVITSGKTNQAYESGEDNDVSLKPQ